MNMNTVEFYTRNIDIVVDLEGYDYDNPEDFVVTIEAGNETKVINVTKREVRQHAYEGCYVILYEALNQFALDNLKITCKYPVVVRCNDFVYILYKFIEPVTTK